VDRTPSGADFHRLRTYANTKRANLITTLAWADRAKGFTVNAVHPGVVRTNLGESRGLLGLVLGLVKRAWWTPEQGAAAPVWLATDPSLAGTTGRYFHLRDPRELAGTRDAAPARALWEKSAALAGLDAPW
jgi:NAD(P)-dependent dehydrogenase (short-subunit alcohol dehydrogenase family)